MSHLIFSKIEEFYKSKFEFLSKKSFSLRSKGDFFERFSKTVFFKERQICKSAKSACLSYFRFSSHVFKSLFFQFTGRVNFMMPQSLARATCRHKVCQINLNLTKMEVLISVLILQRAKRSMLISNMYGSQGTLGSLLRALKSSKFRILDCSSANFQGFCYISDLNVRILDTLLLVGLLYEVVSAIFVFLLSR